jgi:hypothetical protein
MFLLVAMLDKKSCVYQVMWAHDKIHIHKVHFSHKNLDATLENEFLAILEKNVKCIISIIHGKNIFS